MLGSIDDATLPSVATDLGVRRRRYHDDNGNKLPSTTNQQIKLNQSSSFGRKTIMIIVRYFFTLAVVHPALFNNLLTVDARGAGVAHPRVLRKYESTSQGMD